MNLNVRNLQTGMLNNVPNETHVWGNLFFNYNISMMLVAIIKLK